MSATVTTAQTGAAAACAPAGVWLSSAPSAGMTETGANMMTVPVTVGVSIRRTSDSRVESAICKSATANTRVASSAGPPLASAVAQMGTNMAFVPTNMQ